MIETKHGDLHPDTGIPPSFATIKSEMILGKNRQFFIEMGRPTKIHLSLSRLNQLYNIQNKVFHKKRKMLNVCVLTFAITLFYVYLRYYHVL